MTPTDKRAGEAAARPTRARGSKPAPDERRNGATARAAKRGSAGGSGAALPAEAGASAPGAPDSPSRQRRQPTARGALAAGAERATGERRRRGGTPLLPEVGPVEVSTARRAVAAVAEGETPPPGVLVVEAPPVAPIAAGPEGPSSPIVEIEPTTAAAEVEEPATEPAPSADTEAPAGGSSPPAGRRRPTRAAVASNRRAGRAARGARSTGSTQVGAAPVPERPRLRAVRGEGIASGPGSGPGSQATGGGRGIRSRSGAPATSASSRLDDARTALPEAAEFASDVRPGPAELVELAINVLRAAAASSGVPAEDIERQVAETLAYLRRRLTGEVTVDEFGFDRDWTRHVHLPLLRPFYKSWFRVEVKGVENIPSEGGALVVANHSGTVAFDSLMAQVAVHDEHPAHRHLRMLGADLVFRMAFVGTMARRSGSTLADTCDAERLLRGGHVVGVWPEGFKGVGKPFSERYKLQRFGRGGFVAAALRTGVPVVPCSIVGAEEIYPMIGNMPAVARLLGLPYAPITPTFPLLGPLGMIPLPSKWLIEFGAPIDTAAFGDEAADDPMLVFDLTDQVRETIQQTLYSLLMQRTSVFL